MRLSEIKVPRSPRYARAPKRKGDLKLFMLAILWFMRVVITVTQKVKEEILMQSLIKSCCKAERMLVFLA